MSWIHSPNGEGRRPLLTRIVPRTLCVRSILLVLKGHLLEIGSSIGSGVFLLVKFSLGRCATIDGLVLLRGFASGVGGAIGVFFGFFCLEAVDLLLGLGNVLSLC